MKLSNKWNSVNNFFQKLTRFKDYIKNLEAHQSYSKYKNLSLIGSFIRKSIFRGFLRQLESLKKYFRRKRQEFSRSSRPEVFLGNGAIKVLQIYRRTPMPNCDFLRHECSPVNLLHIFRTPFPKNTSGRLFLNF